MAKTRQITLKHYEPVVGVNVMMQIHIDAIQKSKVDDVQYVLRKSLDMVRVSGEEELLTHLKDGWDIVGKYNNGVGYNTYRTTSDPEVASIKCFIEKELLGFEIKPANTVTVSFQEYFAPITCFSDGLNVEIVFYNIVDGKFEYEKFRFEDEKAKRVRDIIFVFHMQQDKKTIIDLIEKRRELLGQKG